MQPICQVCMYSLQHQMQASNISEPEPMIYEPELTVRHHFSPQGRREAGNHRRHARNELWSTAMRAPIVLIPVVIPFRILSQMRYALSRGIRWAIGEPLWWLSAIRGLPNCLRHRRAVRLRDYANWLRLFRNPTSYAPPPAG